MKSAVILKCLLSSTYIGMSVLGDCEVYRREEQGLEKVRVQSHLVAVQYIRISWTLNFNRFKTSKRFMQSRKTGSLCFYSITFFVLSSFVNVQGFRWEPLEVGFSQEFLVLFWLLSSSKEYIQDLTSCSLSRDQTANMCVGVPACQGKDMYYLSVYVLKLQCS